MYGLRSPSDGVRLIERVCAVVGDRVALEDVHLSINGQPLAEADALDVEYLGDRRARLNLDMGGGPEIDGLVVPPGQVLVVGEHRGNSVDVRYFGLVPASAMYARSVGLLWPQGGGPVGTSPSAPRARRAVLPR